MAYINPQLSGSETRKSRFKFPNVKTSKNPGSSTRAKKLLASIKVIAELNRVSN
jgi:hypothetical protein